MAFMRRQVKVVGGGGGLDGHLCQLKLVSDLRWQYTRGYDSVKGCVGKSYDKIEGVVASVGGNFSMLSKITTGKQVNKLNCLSITMVINRDIEVPVMMNSWVMVACERTNENWLRKVEKG